MEQVKVFNEPSTSELSLQPKQGQKLAPYKGKEELAEFCDGSIPDAEHITPGAILYAKVLGFPAWPARVLRIARIKTLVYFYGPGSEKYSWVLHKYLTPFDAQKAQEFITKLSLSNEELADAAETLAALPTQDVVFFDATDDTSRRTAGTRVPCVDRAQASLP